MINQAERVFDALGDGTRRKMITMLNNGPAPASELRKNLNISLPAVVQHIQILESCGLIKTDKIGRNRICRISDDGFDAAFHWLDSRRHALSRKLDILENILNDE